MGRDRSRRAEFLKEFPTCIFCGGTTPATTIDHVPGRVFFYGRQWPVGYEFPACHLCNGATRISETVAALLSRIFPDAPDEASRQELRKLLRAISNNAPEVLNEMQPRAIETRRTLRALGIKKDPNVGTWEQPLLNADGPLMQHHMREFIRKLLPALHFKHFNTIISDRGLYGFHLFSNIDAANGKLPAGLFQVLNSEPTVKRGQHNIEDQFYYIYQGENHTAGYFVMFRQSFAIFGVVVTDASDMPEGPQSKTLKPFSWSA